MTNARVHPRDYRSFCATFVSHTDPYVLVDALRDEVCNELRQSGAQRVDERHVGSVLHATLARPSARDVQLRRFTQLTGPRYAVLGSYAVEAAAYLGEHSWVLGRSRIDVDTYAARGAR